MNNEINCITSCPISYFSDSANSKCISCLSSCNTCTKSSKICSSCSSIRTLVKGTCQCLEKYSHSNGECYDCESSCATCSGPDSDDCLTCIKGLYLEPNNNTCLSSCDPGYYGNSTVYKCLKCDDSCLECDGSLYTDCLSCATNYLQYDPNLEFQDFTCVSTCPSIIL